MSTNGHLSSGSEEQGTAEAFLKNLPEIRAAYEKIGWQAGQLAMEIRGRAGGMQQSRKDDQSLVTEADTAVEEFIRTELSKIPALGDVPAVGEEGAQPFGLKKYQLIDPVDGTHLFAASAKTWTVNIALVFNNQAVAGVFVVPALNKIFSAAKGQGAWMHEIPELHAEFDRSTGTTTMLKTHRPNLNGLIAVTGDSRSWRPALEFYKAMGIPENRIIEQGSTTKYALFVDETMIHATQPEAPPCRADILVRGPCREWDVAPAYILLQEAGFQIIDLETGQMPLFGTAPDFKTPRKVAITNFDLRAHAYYSRKDEVLQHFIQS